MTNVDSDISELDDETRAILEDAIERNARLRGAYGNGENDEVDTEIEGPRALTRGEALLKYAGADVEAMKREMIQKCREWQERSEAINRECEEGRMSEFNAINAGSDLRREKARAYHNWRLGSIGLSKKRIVEGAAEPYDAFIRALAGDPKPSEPDTDE